VFFIIRFKIIKAWRRYVESVVLKLGKQEKKKVEEKGTKKEKFLQVYQKWTKNIEDIFEAYKD